MLSEIQKRLLEFLGDQQASNGFLPSVREVMKFLRVRSTNTAQYHLTRLRAEGYLESARGRARAYSLTQRAREFLGTIDERARGAASRLGDAVGSAVRGRPIPLLGRITAGALDLAVEDPQDALDLAQFMGADEATFALRVEGDSMRGAGIFDGDIVVVRRQSHIRDGEIGAVLVDDETTVKTIHYEGDEIVLRPANPEHQDIRVPLSHPALQVCGRVIGVVRRV